MTLGLCLALLETAAALPGRGYVPLELAVAPLELEDAPLETGAYPIYP